MKRGFTLVENIVAVAIFALLAGVIYQTSALLIRTVGIYRENSTISSLANQYMEVVHNLPYASVGTLEGVPNGSLPDEGQATVTKVNNVNYKIYYVVKLVDDPADGLVTSGDSAPADYKQVKLYVENVASGKKHSFVTNITPKGLEGINNGGALVISVIDANGNAVPGANVSIKNASTSPTINLNRTTDSNGKIVEVGLKESANSYHLVATKSGYSTDQTYPITAANPNPTKPDSTVQIGQVTQISLAIDKLSSLSFDTLSQDCNVMGGVEMKITGAKLIGNPALLKFNQDYTSNAQGKISLGSIEWDSYTPTLIGGNMIYGSSPIQEVSVLPNTTQNFTLLLGPKTANSFLVIVKDSATGNPVENATVRLQSSSRSFDESKITGGSVWSTASWSPSLTQENVSTDETPYALRLRNYGLGTPYSSNGYLVSEIFDTNTASTTYSTLTWQPTSQSTSTAVKFQIATSPDNTSTTTWSFLGPDGTGSSFYTTSGNSINNPAARYVRYKVFLDTEDTSVTPLITSVNVNYISGCFTPGQTFFPGLDQATDYSLTISADGYITQTISDLNITGYQNIDVLLVK